MLKIILYLSGYVMLIITCLGKSTNPNSISETTQNLNYLTPVNNISLSSTFTKSFVTKNVYVNLSRKMFIICSPFLLALGGKGLYKIFMNLKITFNEIFFMKRHREPIMYIIVDSKKKNQSNNSLSLPVSCF